MVALLGVEVTLCASAGGEVGTVLAGLLDTTGITVRVVSRPASSGWYVHDRRGGRRRSVADYPGAAFGPAPQLVLSGINRGANAGHAVLHSGTVGAALTAANYGVPSLA